MQENLLFNQYLKDRKERKIKLPIVNCKYKKLNWSFYQQKISKQIWYCNEVFLNFFIFFDYEIYNSQYKYFKENNFT